MKPPGRFWIRQSNAPLCTGQVETFQITHPFHPWFGKTYLLLTYRQSWGEDRVYFHDEAGDIWSIPARWTNVVADDPFVVVAAGRSPFRVTDLIQLGLPFTHIFGLSVQRHGLILLRFWIFTLLASSRSNGFERIICPFPRRYRHGKDPKPSVRSIQISKNSYWEKTSVMGKGQRLPLPDGGRTRSRIGQASSLE